MADKYLFANNATSRLRIDTPAGSSTITLPSGQGVRFPQPAAGEFFMVTLDDRRSGQIEICRCTARTGDVLTVIRGQEGTTARAFAGGTLISNRITAGTLAYFLELSSTLAGYTKDEADELFVAAAGDTMTGHLVLPNLAPTDPNHAARKKYVDDGLATRAPKDHSHSIDQVTGLTDALDARPTHAPNDGKPYAAYNLGWVDISSLATPYWNDIQDKPLTFPPEDHEHPISEVTGLTAALDGLVEEAPQDGTPYARQDAAWVAASSGGGGIGEAPNDGKTYGRKNLAWAEVAGGASISVGDLPPGSPVDNSLWWSSTTGVLAIRYYDGDTYQWVGVTGGGIGDAPIDTKTYARKGGLWSELPVTNWEKGRAKCWIDFSGVSVPASIIVSFGIASLTDIGVGNYRPNTIAAFSTQYFAVLESSGAGAYFNSGYAETSTSFRDVLMTPAGVLIDASTSMNAAAFGDLA